MRALALACVLVACTIGKMEDFGANPSRQRDRGRPAAQTALRATVPAAQTFDLLAVQALPKPDALIMVLGSADSGARAVDGPLSGPPPSPPASLLIGSRRIERPPLLSCLAQAMTCRIRPCTQE